MNFQSQEVNFKSEDRESLVREHNLKDESHRVHLHLIIELSREMSVLFY